MHRRARVGLNKGESHHALKQAINFYRRGEIRDRTTEGQHYRIAGLNRRIQVAGRLDPMTVIPSQLWRSVGSIGTVHATNQESDDDADEIHWP
jgi:Tn3 transposase DDE domain